MPIEDDLLRSCNNLPYLPWSRFAHLLEKEMVSPTAQTRVIRTHKKKSMGRKRKNAIANAGSTLSQEKLFGSKEPAENDKNK
ncbi:MAG TPA: hypothetical protein VEL47_02395 [Myxococcota bacterium]|nr:hypothetical protein [Myxococcota bacterium]